jgi:phosphatidylserine/phosphatidylglycerophosphate/cardiolipin synthase-like enzyme
MKRIGIVIVFSFLALSCSHSQVREGGGSDLFGPMEDMHILEDLSYPESPFDALIKDAFKNNRNYINVLNLGDDALVSRIHLVRMAKKSINIQTFIWGDDSTAEFLAYELIKAAKRGVKVNIIIDGVVHNNIPKNETILGTVNPNIRVKYYNPIAKRVAYSRIQLLGRLFTSFKKLNQRMHNKLFIVDDRIGITGGRNYRPDYFDRGKHRNFQDRGCMVIGPLVREMTDSFMDYWAFKWSVVNYDLLDIKDKIENGPAEPVETEKIFELEDVFFGLDKQASDYEYIKNTFVEKAYLVDFMEYISDGPGKKNNSRAFRSSSVAEDLSEFISGAKESLIMQTPYLVLPRKAERVFKKLKRRNPDIDIRVSTNSLSTTDNFIAYALSYQNKKKYLKKLKWRIFEFKHDPVDADLIVRPINPQERADDYIICIHGKSYVVDKEKVYIGSFNIDPRSIDLNTESGLLIYDKKVAQDVADDILRAMAPQNSWAIGKAKRIPVVGQLNAVVEDTAKKMPVLDIWPNTYATSFGLIEGKEELPFYHEDFYKHYKSVGLFPDVKGTQKGIKTRLFKALFGKMTEPLI